MEYTTPKNTIVSEKTAIKPSSLHTEVHHMCLSYHLTHNILIELYNVVCHVTHKCKTAFLRTT